MAQRRTKPDADDTKAEATALPPDTVDGPTPPQPVADPTQPPPPAPPPEQATEAPVATKEPAPSPRLRKTVTMAHLEHEGIAGGASWTMAGFFKVPDEAWVEITQDGDVITLPMSDVDRFVHDLQRTRDATLARIADG